MDRPRTGTPCSSSAAGVFLCPGRGGGGAAAAASRRSRKRLLQTLERLLGPLLMEVWWGRCRRSRLVGPNGGSRKGRQRPEEETKKKDGWLGVWASKESGL
jgi:hypothetical protein